MYFTFTPTTPGTYNGTVTVTSDATGGTNTIAYTGTATGTTPTPEVTRHIYLAALGTGIPPGGGTMALGSVAVGQSVTTNITIGNTGNDTLTWTDVSTGSAAVTTDTPSGSLPRETEW